MSDVTSATFSLVDYKFPNVMMNGANQPKSDILSINFKTEGSYNESTGRFELLFTTFVSEKGMEPFISVLCLAQYQFTEKVVLNSIPDYFYANSIAILFPYVRAYISLLTTQANQKAVILPTLNLTPLAAELQKNTKISYAEN